MELEAAAVGPGGVRPLRAGRLPHDLRRRQRRAGGGRRHAGHPPPQRLPALRAAGQAVDAGRARRLGRLPHEPVQRGLRGRGLRGCSTTWAGGWALGVPAAAIGALLLAVSPELLGRGQRPARLRAERALRAAGGVVRAGAGTAAGATARCWLACLLCGLGAANHTFMGVVAIAIGLFALWPRGPRSCGGRGCLLAMPAGALAWAAALRLPAPALTHGPAPGLGQSGDAAPRSWTWSCAATSGNAAWIEGPGDLLVDRRRLPAAAWAPSCCGWARR